MRRELGSAEGQKGNAVQLPAAPGPPPRRISLAEWHAHLPAFLQIGTVVTPVCAMAAVIWIAVMPSEKSFRLAFTAAWTLLLAMGWALMYRRRLTSFPAVRAVIIAFSPGAVGRVSATVVHYRYEVGGTTHQGTHTVFDAKELAVGQGIWVLVNPRRPEGSMAWL